MGAMLIAYCKTCLMPNTRPRIEFDDDGVCNACHTAARKASIDWDARRAEYKHKFSGLVFGKFARVHIF